MNPQDFPPDTAVMVGDDIMTPDQYDQQRKQQVGELYTAFASMRDKWVQHRAQSGVERRWRRSTELYYGDQAEYAGNELENTLRNGPPARKPVDGTRSRVVVNIVRPKVDQATARMCEILFPVDDRNWAIKPTPIPEIAERSGDQRPTVDPATGQPTGLTADQEVKFVLEAAKQAAQAMQDSIDDDLTECAYNGESRKMVEDGVRLGTGILKGPFPTNRTSKVWNPQPGGTQELQINIKTAPTSARVDPWDIFFDPACGNDHQRGRGVFHRRNVTRKELRALVGLPGYDEEAIREILREEPKKVRVAEQRVIRETMKEDAYELWEYHGEFEADDVQALSERTGDPLEDVSFVVMCMVNDKIIGVMPSWVVDNSLPYDVWNWRKADDSPYGFSLPDELEHQQRVVNSAWRQVMDNGRVSLGGQIVMKKGMVIPQNGNYEITPNKIWLAKDDLADVRQAFSVFEFNSHLDELLKIAQAAMTFADTESNLPQMMGGQPGNVPETVGGMVMLYNNANSVLRQRVKLYDDNVTRPHIGRYYDFKMANDPDTKIKGDFEVDARGSTSLIERDIQNQAMLNLANITNNARYIPHLKEREELKAILKAFKIDPEQLLKSEDVVAQEAQAAAEQGQPQDPRLQVAQMNAEMKQAELADRKEERALDREVAVANLQVKQEEMAYNRQREQGEYEIAMTDAAITRDTTLAKLQQDAQLTREEIAAKDRLETLKIDNQRQLFTAEAALKVRQGSGI